MTYTPEPGWPTMVGGALGALSLVCVVLLLASILRAAAGSTEPAWTRQPWALASTGLFLGGLLVAFLPWLGISLVGGLVVGYFVADRDERRAAEERKRRRPNDSL